MEMEMEMEMEGGFRKWCVDEGSFVWESHNTNAPRSGSLLALDENRNA